MSSRTERPSRRGTVLFTVCSVALASAVTPTAAQLPDLPVIHEPIRNEFVRAIVGITGGRGIGDDSGNNSSWVLFGARRFSESVTLGVMAGLRYPDVAPDDARARGQVGARADIRLNPGRHDVTWSLVGGLGYGAVSSEIGEWNAPVGVAGAWYALKGAVPGRPGGPMLKLWGMPRYHLRVANLGGDTVWQHGAGLSAGVTLGLEEGLGVTVGGEWLHLMRKTGATVAAPAADRFTVSATLRLHVK